MLKTRWSLTILIVMVGILQSGCDVSSDNPEPKTFEPDTRALNTLLFEDGSWWAFEDSTTLKKDTFILSYVFYGHQNVYEGKRLIHTRFTYQADLRQTSTNRKFIINYNSAWDAKYKNIHTPIVELIGLGLKYASNQVGKTGYEHILFNTAIGDTVPGGHAILYTEPIGSKFILQEKSVGISIFGKNYSEPYYKMKILKSVAYDLKDLDLLLIENVGFAHHTIEGNYYLTDYFVTKIVP